jgi:hypothetical protein
MKYEHPPGGSGVDGVLQALEPDAPFLEAIDDVDQVAQRAAEPVQLPNSEDVALADVG